MKMSAQHVTTYLYSEPVSICHTEVHLSPRNVPGQKLLSFELEIRPEPDFLHSRTDYFGNSTTYFAIHEPHQTLTVEAMSELEIEIEEPPCPELTPAWERVREQVRDAIDEECFLASEFLYRSPLIAHGCGTAAGASREFAAYARTSFGKDRPVQDAAFDLCRRIFKDFKYDPRATTISTPVAEVLKLRAGVCQDFAHVMIACLRSIGLPARYVSGYLKSGENTRGAEASHAWCSVFCPGFGWLDFDPTNDTIPHGEHVTLAFGRDYSDVTPVKGVALGGGEQIINVSVGVGEPGKARRSPLPRPSADLS